MVPVITEYRIIAILDNGSILELEAGFIDYDDAVESAKVYEKQYDRVELEQY